MYSADKEYILKLAKGLHLSNPETLNFVMGPNELKSLLKTTSTDDFIGPRTWINLHTHSNASDGNQPPTTWIENVLHWKKTNHLSRYVIALTDHDTLNGLIPVLKYLIKHKKEINGLRIILGCELSATFEDPMLRRPVDFEILHYGIDPFDKNYTQLLQKQSKIRQKQIPIIFDALNQKYPHLNIKLNDFYRSSFYGENIKKGLGVNWLYNIMSYIRSLTQDTNTHNVILDELLAFGFQQRNNHMWYSAQTLLKFIKKHGGFASMAHPYRLQLNQRLNANVNDFIPHFFKKLKTYGLSGTELNYGKLHNMQSSFKAIQSNIAPQNETDHWVRLIWETSRKLFPYATGGSDNHGHFLGNFQFKEKENAWQQLLSCWHTIQPLIKTGYHLLDKEVTMGLPGPCMPAYDSKCDSGIGSPYGKGADRVWQFWDKTIDKILLGPGGKTSKETKHSPYVSDDQHPNPFFIPIENLVPNTTTNKDFDFSHLDTTINFNRVEKNYHNLFQQQKYTQKQIDLIASKIKSENMHPYIADMQIYLPTKLTKQGKDLFLPNFTLGTPADNLTDKPRNWGFPVFNPDMLWTPTGDLGPAAKIWQQIIDNTLVGAKGGLRIDHFIGLVNPYLISQDPSIPNGRLYSSFDHPILKKYALTNSTQFYRIVAKIVLPVLKKHHLHTTDLYPEDIGARPTQLDNVLNHFGLGRLVVAQFNNPNEINHMYNLMNTRKQDIATLDTHDTPSIQMFFDGLNDAQRYAYAQSLAKSLRFNYTDDLKSTEQLTRMQWGQLFTCPAKRVQAFFTSWTGQIGRYNEPGNPNKWQLRCASNFDEVYFMNLAKGRAYNPLDAIALAIYARGDSYYQKNKNFVTKLRTAEINLFNLIHQWINA